MNHENREAAATGEVLFAAANSGRGFVSFYDGVFEGSHLKRRYIIKGGPGTGKSGLMKAVAAEAERKGKKVRYYRCSSDPDSLDGILIDDRIAMMDGTAPHTVEPTYPGARDELLNLGEFWDGEALASRYDEIRALSAQKQDGYRRAYRYLSAATDLREINGDLLLPYVKHGKMKGAVDRLLREIPNGTEFEMTSELRSSIGMKGQVTFHTYERMSGRLYSVEDHYDTGYLFLCLLIEGARRKRCPIRVSYQPLIPSRPDGVFFCGNGTCFVLNAEEGSSADGVIHMRRFVDAGLPTEIRRRFRMNRKMSEGLILGAEDALAEVGMIHSELERIYGECMDFDGLNRFIRSFCQSLLADTDWV